MEEKVIGQAPEETIVESKPTGEVEKVEVEATPEQSRRFEVEEKIQKDRETFPEPVVEEVKVEEKVADKVEAADPTKTVKDKVQKRIDKAVAKQKTAEEELAQVRAENEKLKSQIKPPAESEADVKREPTDAEIRTALLKAKRDGDLEFEVQILEYMAERKAKKERAEAELTLSESRKKQAEQVEQFQKDWKNIELDYQSENPEMNLSNPKSLLYRTAKALYEDKDLAKSVYSDPNRAHAMRLAVSDAFREIVENNLLPGNKETVEEVKPSETKLRKRAQLADPSSSVAEEIQTVVKDLSDTEKVLNDVKRRKKIQEERIRS